MPHAIQLRRCFLGCICTLVVAAGLVTVGCGKNKDPGQTEVGPQDPISSTDPVTSEDTPTSDPIAGSDAGTRSTSQNSGSTDTTPGRSTKDNTGDLDSSSIAKVVPEDADAGQTPQADRKLVSSLTALASADVLARESASQTLQADQTETVRTIKIVLSDQAGDAGARKGALFHLLGIVKPFDKELGDLFVQSLSDTDAEVRAMAMQGLPQLSAPIRSQAAPALHEMILNADETAANRATAIRTVVRSIQSSDTAVTLQQAALKDSVPEVRVASLVSLRKVMEVNDAFEVFRTSLDQDQSPLVRKMAAKQIGRIGPYTNVMLALAKGLADTDDSVITTCGQILSEMPIMDADAIAEQLQSEQAATRRTALFVLGKLGDVAKPHSAAIQKLTKDTDTETRELATAIMTSFQ